MQTRMLQGNLNGVSSCKKSRALRLCVTNQVETQVQRLSPCKRRVTITVPAKSVKDHYANMLKRLEREVVGTLPGFRREKVPLDLVVQTVGGKKNFKMAMVEEVLLKSMEEVLKGLNEPVVGESERIITTAVAMYDAYDPSKPFCFETEFDVYPKVSWKTPYKELQVELQDTGDMETDKAAVEDLIKQYLKQSGRMRVVQGRGLERGDMSIIDMCIRRRTDNRPLPGLKKSKFPFDTDADPLDLTSHLSGMQPEESRSFDVTFPDDYAVEMWQNMPAKAEIKLHELFSWVMPEFTDEFVKEKFGAQFQSAEEMRRSLLATTAYKRMEALDRQLEQQVIMAVVTAVEVEELPEKLVEDVGEQQFRLGLMQMIEKGIATVEEIEEEMNEQMLREYIQKRRPFLEEIVKFSLAQEVIASEQNLAPSDEEIEEEMKGRVKQFEEKKVEYDAGQLRVEIIEEYTKVRVLEWLKDNLKRTVIPYNSSPPALV